MGNPRKERSNRRRMMTWTKIHNFNHLKGLCKYTKDEWAHVMGTKVATVPVDCPEGLSDTERSLLWKCLSPHELKYLILWVKVDGGMGDGRIIGVAWTEGGVEL